MRGRWAVIGVAVLALAAFLPALANGPIEDDLPLLHRRLAGVHSLADLLPLLRESYWGALHNGGLYRPLTLATLGLQRLAFGDRLWAFRIVSLLLHVACSLLCLRLATQLMRTDGRGEGDTTPIWAFGAAALFAVHPIHAEAVVTIYGQADVWAALFALAAVCLDGAWRRTDRPAWRWLAIAALFLLSLGFKESAMALPVGPWLLAGSQGRWKPDARLCVVAGAWLIYLPVRLAVLGSDWTPPTPIGGGGWAGVWSPPA